MSKVGKGEWEATSRLDRRKGRWLACEVRSGVWLLDPLGFQPPFFALRFSQFVSSHRLIAFHFEGKMVNSETVSFNSYLLFRTGSSACFLIGSLATGDDGEGLGPSSNWVFIKSNIFNTKSKFSIT